ncbi:chloride channel [Nitzschia inconspicua]|uniref:Chloride channel n=1 Tax=Nitzschia inconspicua TaxID=303405 RepID=A0A9K3KNR8_9STRA|nr:chloride channel [Nitzschia inconspicua]
MSRANGDTASETSPLLPTTVTSDLEGPNLRHDNQGSFNGETIEVAEMKKVTHNDPSLATEAEDFKNLLGSTRFLYNNVRADEMSQTLRRQTVDDFRGIGRTKHVDGEISSSNRLSMIYHQQRDHAMLYLEKVKTSFFQDAKSLAEGTIPQSVVLALVIGVVCGVACWLYYSILFFFLELLWTTLPDQVVVNSWDEKYYWLWIPLVSTTMITCVGLTVVYMGEPGDLPYTIGRVHAQAFIPMNHVSPMVFSSLFSILAGGSLGPEAPLVAICGALGGFVSRRIFLQKHINVVRKHTLMGMGGALAAFFGVPLGGSLFALEVCSRFGVEYFEHLIEAIFCGEICLVVFRSLSGLPIQPIWDLTAISGRMMSTTPMHVLLGAVIGLYGAFWATVFARFHWKVMAMFGKLNLLDNQRAVYRGWLGGFFVILMAVLVPHTAFWGEEEIQIVATMSPAKDLPNIWPTTGLLGFEMNSPFHAFIVGICKLIAISFTVSGGLRGGYIFPLMCSGAAFGRLLYYVLPESVPMQLAVLCTAAGMNVAITRTSLATTLILAFLPGEPVAIPAILMASICSLFATSYMPFIKSQITRSDIDHSLFHEEHHISVGLVLEEEHQDDH